MTAAFALLAGLALAAAPLADRFSGQATLESPAAVSADSRFRVDAELQPGDRRQSAARYTLDARLDAGAEAKSAAASASCAADGTIFSNGFE